MTRMQKPETAEEWRELSRQRNMNDRGIECRADVEYRAAKKYKERGRRGRRRKPVGNSVGWDSMRLHAGLKQLFPPDEYDW